MPKQHAVRAFSLVELSIVLVILGLLVGGVLSGKSLIHAAELRKITKEVDLYRTSSFTFRDKYFSIPGDITNATSFWGKDTTNCNAAAGSAGSPGTCNGNGDGTLNDLASGSGEPRFFWIDLALSGLITGSYSLPASGGYYQVQLFGTQTPSGAIANSGYTVANPLSATATSVMFYPAARDKFLLILSSSGYVGNTTTSYMGFGGNLLIPEDAWNIDSKTDDGLPGTGKVTSQRYTDGITLAAQNCSSNIDPALAVYNLTQTPPYCGLAFAIN